MTSRSPKGYIMISMVLVISVVIISIATTVAMLSIGDAQSSLNHYKGESSLAFVESCAENGLIKSQADNNYSGGTIIYPQGDCSINISKNGITWTMTASSNDNKNHRTVEVIFTRDTPNIIITSWKEI